MRRPKITIAQLRSKCASYNIEVRATDKYEGMWSRTILRQVSYYLALLFLKLGISANIVSYLGIMVGCLGCGLLAFTNYEGMIVGALLINISLLLGYVDGNVARGSNSTSNHGRLLNNISFVIVGSLLFFAAGIGAFRQPDFHLDWLLRWLFYVELDKSIYLVLGSWTAICMILTSLFLDEFEIIYSSRVARFSGYFLKGNSPWKTLLRRTGYNLIAMIVPLLLLAVIFRFLSSFLLFYAMFYSAASIFILVKLIGAARTTDQIRKTDVECGMKN
ncbi:hypothetical protein ACFLW8_05530 [Chloroflexota bacterium]